VRARGAVTTLISRVRQCGNAHDGGTVGAGRWQGAAGEHRWGPGVAPGRRSGGGAHPSGGSACGAERGVGAGAVAGVGGEGAPVSGCVADGRRGEELRRCGGAVKGICSVGGYFGRWRRQHAF
jgi:hypothetical protein